MDLPLDDHYFNTVAKLDAAVVDGEARVARQRELLERSKLSPGQTKDAQRTLDLMLDIVASIREMRTRYISAFRGTIH